MAELRQPPLGPPWAVPTEIYLASHRIDRMTNLVLEYDDDRGTLPPVVVVPLGTDELQLLIEDLILRADDLQLLAGPDPLDDLYEPPLSPDA